MDWLHDFTKYFDDFTFAFSVGRGEALMRLEHKGEQPYEANGTFSGLYIS